MDAFKPFVKAVGRGEKLKRDLTYDEMREATRLILTRQATDAQIGAFLIAQRVKGEAVAELQGLIDEVGARFSVPIPHQQANLLDLATPWDGKAKTAQLAPAVALTLRAAGLPVFLAGAAGIPTKQGVTVGAVLGELGVSNTHDAQAAGQALDAIGFAYCDAAQFAPAWHALTPIRNQFGLRTVCNTVEKLFNPAHAAFQVSGFFHGNYIRRIRSTQSGVQTSFIVQGEEGSLEIAAGKRTPVFGSEESADSTIDSTAYSPSERVRIELPPLLAAHVAINRTVIAGETSPATLQVAITAGSLLYLLSQAASLADGIDKAQMLLSTGAVKQTYAEIKEANL